MLKQHESCGGMIICSPPPLKYSGVWTRSSDMHFACRRSLGQSPTSAVTVDNTNKFCGSTFWFGIMQRFLSGLTWAARFIFLNKNNKKGGHINWMFTLWLLWQSYFSGLPFSKCPTKHAHWPWQLEDSGSDNQEEHVFPSSCSCLACTYLDPSTNTVFHEMFM